MTGESTLRQHKWNQERWQPELPQGSASGALSQRNSSASGDQFSIILEHSY